MSKLRVSMFIFLIISGCDFKSENPSAENCYTFTSIHESCVVGIATYTGCTINGVERSWNDICLGYFDEYSSNRTLCFAEELDTGKQGCNNDVFGSIR